MSVLYLIKLIVSSFLLCVFFCFANFVLESQCIVVVFSIQEGPPCTGVSMDCVLPEACRLAAEEPWRIRP